MLVVAIWPCKFILEFNDKILELTIVYHDNESCIRLFENPVFYHCSKHIDIWFYYLMKSVQKGVVVLDYALNLQVVDVLKKPLAKGSLTC